MKRFIRNNAALLGIFAVTLLSTAVTLLYNRLAGIIGLTIWAALVVFSVVSNVLVTRKTQRLLLRLDRQFDTRKMRSLDTFPMPMIVCSEKGVVLWYNTLFKNSVIGDFRPDGEEVLPFLNGQTMEDVAAHTRLFTCVAGRYYSIFSFP